MRSLVVAPNWIGDAVMAQPLVALLAGADPGGRIDALAPPHIAPIMRAMPGIEQVFESPNRHGKLDLGQRWRTARQLAAQRYDRAFVLPNSLKSALIPFMAGIGLRIGHRGEARYGLINRLHEPSAPAGGPDPGGRVDGAPTGLAASHDVPSGRTRPETAVRPPMVEHYARLALPPGQAAPARVPDPVLRADTAQVAAVRRRIGLGDEPTIVLAPGAEYGPAKRWPARHFAALAHLVADEWPEAAILLVGSAAERTMATEIVALSGLALRNLCGETRLDEALALIADARGVVSNDSGLMHVAAAYGRPQVALFGSSDPRHTPPRSPRARVQWLHLPCSPCFERQCPLGHTDCLNRLSPMAAFQALAAAMRETTSARR